MESVKAVESMKGDRGQSISHGLGVLKDAASDSSAELREASRDKLAQLKDSVKAVDHAVHEKPWLYLAAATIVVGLAGYVFGRRNSK